MNLRFHAYGHPAVLSKHPTTIEITKLGHLTERGDCVVAVNSSIGPRDLPTSLKDALRRRKRCELIMNVGPYIFAVKGEGDPRLTFSHPTDLVVRRSRFISDRTIMIKADKSAVDLPREMVRMLQDPANRVAIEITTGSAG